MWKMARHGASENYTRLRKRAQSELCKCNVFGNDSLVIVEFLSKEALLKNFGILYEGLFKKAKYQ